MALVVLVLAVRGVVTPLALFLIIEKFVVRGLIVLVLTAGRLSRRNEGTVSFRLVIGALLGMKAEVVLVVLLLLVLMLVLVMVLPTVPMVLTTELTMVLSLLLEEILTGFVVREVVLRMGLLLRVGVLLPRLLVLLVLGALVAVSLLKTGLLRLTLL